MNEIDLIREQLRREASHATEVAALWAQAHGPGGPALQQACVDYLAWVLPRFEDRDQKLAERLRSGVGSARNRAALEALARPGTSRDALASLERAMKSALAGAPPTASAADFAQQFARHWQARRAAIDAALPGLASVADWRAIADIDADSILEERERYERVQQLRPPLPGGTAT